MSLKEQLRLETEQLRRELRDARQGVADRLQQAEVDKVDLTDALHKVDIYTSSTKE